MTRNPSSSPLLLAQLIALARTRNLHQSLAGAPAPPQVVPVRSSRSLLFLIHKLASPCSQILLTDCLGCSSPPTPRPCKHRAPAMPACTADRGPILLALQAPVRCTALGRSRASPHALASLAHAMHCASPSTTARLHLLPPQNSSSTCKVEVKKKKGVRAQVRGDSVGKKT